MITFDELNTQNHKITELSNVLSYLLADRSMCDTEVTCKLFFDYVDRVKEHLEMENKEMYSRLLTHKDKRVSNKAKLFLSGEVEIKRIFSAYLKKWCRKQKQELRIRDYDAFRRETEDLFEIVFSSGFGTITHAIKGNVDILMALVMQTGAAIGAQIGATATRFFAGPRIRLAFSFLPLIGAGLVLIRLFTSGALH